MAAISTGHLRCFLVLAATFGYIVEHYSDTAQGWVAKDSAGHPRIAHVVLQPAILFTGAKVPTDAAVMTLHCAAHAEYSMGNAVSTSVETVGVWHHAHCLDSYDPSILPPNV